MVLCVVMLCNFIGGFQIAFFFHFLENGGSRFPQNVGNHI
jgi:formate/nitrite transporter FocA (FNT family)